MSVINCTSVLIKVNDTVIGNITSLNIKEINNNINLFAERVIFNKEFIALAFRDDISKWSQFAPLQIICNNIILQNAWIEESNNPCFETKEFLMYEPIKLVCEKIKERIKHEKR